MQILGLLANLLERWRKGQSPGVTVTETATLRQQTVTTTVY